MPQGFSGMCCWCTLGESTRYITSHTHTHSQPGWFRVSNRLKHLCIWTVGGCAHRKLNQDLAKTRSEQYLDWGTFSLWGDSAKMQNNSWFISINNRRKMQNTTLRNVSFCGPWAKIGVVQELCNLCVFTCFTRCYQCLSPQADRCELRGCLPGAPHQDEANASCAILGRLSCWISCCVEV